jgi:adhesin/invasin
MFTRNKHEDHKTYGPSMPANKFRRSRQCLSWLIIMSQLALPISLPLAPATASAAPKKKIVTMPYVLGPGETPSSVAKNHQLSLEELRQLNIYRSFSKPFALLSIGDEIDIPKKPTKFDFTDRILTPSPSMESKLAGGVVATSDIFKSENSGQAATNMARSTATAEANAAVAKWLNLHGTARVQLNTDDKLRLNNSALDVLLPVYDKPDSLLFTQLGIRNNDNRNTANIGVGARFMHDNWLYGVNTFYDYDMTGNNRRIGVGGEAWTDYLKLSVNGYKGLSDWHQSRDFADYNERPANGYDLRAEAYLPAYPQLGGKLVFEQYHGGEVALFGKDHRQKNPYAVTAGLSYTPIPLVQLGVDHRAGKGSRNSSSFNVQFNYQLGRPWTAQIDPSAIGRSRTLAGSRYDLVERNNNIVLDYQKQQTIQLSLPERISGDAGSTTTISAQVTANNGLKNIEWDYGMLIVAGGEFTMTSSTEAVLRLPLYQPGNNNVHTLGAVAYDTKGNASERAMVRITVNEQNVSIAQSHVTATPASIIANGTSTSQIAINLRDGNNQPIIGRATDLALALEFVPGSTKAATDEAVSSPLTVSDITEKANGEYIAVLTAGTELGNASIIPTLSGQALNKTQVTLITDALDTIKSELSADRLKILADDTEFTTMKFSARDSNGHPISGLEVTFDVTSTSGVPLSDITLSGMTESEGVYTATLKGKTPGSITMKPLVGGKAVGALSVDIELAVGVMASDKTTFTASSLRILADDSDFATLTFAPKDASEHPISGLTVAFDVTGASGTTLSGMTESAGVYTATLKGKAPGSATVKPMVGGKAVGTLSVDIELTVGAIESDKTTFTASSLRILADDSDFATLTFAPKDASEHPISGLDVKFDVTSAGGMSLSDITLSGMTESAGVYTATLKGKTPGSVTVKPLVGGKAVGTLSVDIELTVGAMESTKSTFTASSLRILADDSDFATLTFAPKDASEHPISGLTVAFDVTGASVTTLSGVTESAGVYTATLKGKTPGSVTVKPLVGGKAVGTLSVDIELAVGAVDSTKSTFTASSLRILADDSDSATLTFAPKDASEHPISGLTVAFDVTGASGTTLSGVTESAGVYTATLKGKAPGSVTVKPLVGGKAVGALSVDIELAVGAVDSTKSTLAASTPLILADNTGFSTLTFKAMDASGRAITGLDVSFEVSGVAGTTIKDITESDGIYTAKLIGNTAGMATVVPKVSSVVVSGLNTKVTLNPKAVLTKIAVNKHNFDIDENFPRVAFKGAQFQLEVSGTKDNNDVFSWKSNDGAVSVDEKGVVTINNPTSSEVRITLTDKSIPANTTSYTFRLNKWFINNNLGDVSSAASDKWCATQGSGFRVPSASQITNGGGAGNRAAAGELINVWGEMDKFANDWTIGSYWVTDIAAANGNRTPVHFYYGWTIERPEATANYRTTCVRDL